MFPYLLTSSPSLFLLCLVLSWCHRGSQATSVCFSWGVFPKGRSVWRITSLHWRFNVSRTAQAQGVHGKDYAVHTMPLLYWIILRFMFKWTRQCLLFQVGCGAIGCEMLKNFALLGVGLANSSGEVGVLPAFHLVCLAALLYVLQYIS